MSINTAFLIFQDGVTIILISSEYIYVWTVSYPSVVSSRAPDEVKLDEFQP